MSRCARNDRARPDCSMSQSLWAQERGAITQEVQQDNSDAFYRLFVKMQGRLIGGTPYAKNTLGTVNDFAQHVNGAQLRRFYDRWYHPNNAVYIIAGDVDPPTTIAQRAGVLRRPARRQLPRREPVRLGPLHPALYHDTSDQGYTAVVLGYRFPGYESPDYAAGQILGDVFSSSRSAFGSLPYTGRALATEFFAQEYPKTAVALAFAAVPVPNRPNKSIGKCARSSTVTARTACRPTSSRPPNFERSLSSSLAATRSKAWRLNGARPLRCSIWPRRTT